MDIGVASRCATRAGASNDNLPGTRDFCPLVRLSDPLNAAGQFDPRAALAGLDAEAAIRDPRAGCLAAGHPPLTGIRGPGVLGPQHRALRRAALRTRAGDAGWPEFAWRFPDLTEHALYTCRLIESTIVDQMAGEARVLRRFDTASRRLKAVIEMPDPDVTRVIRSLKENGWAASGKLLKEYPVFDDPSRQQQAIEAVRSAFEDRPPANIAGA
jgi:hypothetical protein